MRHCLHGYGFICNRICFDAVTPFVYSAPVEFVIRTAGRFQYAFKSGAFSKRYGFIGRVNGETASIKKLSGRNWLAREVCKYGKSRTECSALLHNHNSDLWFNFTFTAFVYFTINREPDCDNRQRCLEMLTFSSIRSFRVTKRKAKRRFWIRMNVVQRSTMNNNGETENN